MLTIKDLYALCRSVKSDIVEDYQAFEWDEQPGIQLTVACDEDGNWSYQTGNNEYMGSAYRYPYWSVVGVYKDSNC